MSLNDREILELTELCNALVDGTLTEAQRMQLADKLAASEEARRFYVRFTGLSASLCAYASELQTEATEQPAPPRSRAGWWWGFGALAAAAALAFGIWFVTTNRPRENGMPAETDADEFVAQVTGVHDCPFSLGDQIRRGQCLDFERGIVEITFDCGAQVTLEAPAVLRINSAWDATLERGKLKASVPSEAVGFRIANPAVEVVDLGTEFSLVAQPGGTAELYVLKGEVKATGTDQAALVLHEHDARRFSETNSTVIADATRELAKLAQPVPLNHGSNAANYAHWSFDAADHPELGGVRTAGRWHEALQFDGKFDAQLPLAGISKNAARTVAFWVNVPNAAPLGDAGEMVAWLAQAPRKLGVQAVQIGWNTDPTAGPLGALRTEFGRGMIVGSTSLRDGRWHHVAVVFALGGRLREKLHVKQYIDGRLEGVTKLAKKHHRPKFDVAVNDVVWLGRRLGQNSAASERFHGALDELFVADQALTPLLVKNLMKTNNPLVEKLATTK